MLPLPGSGNTVSPAGDTITLAPGQSYAERAHSRPDNELPDGQYSMVIEATGPVVAIVMDGRKFLGLITRYYLLTYLRRRAQ